MHGATALSYVYLLLSGLAFWTPAFFWIAIVLGGGYLTRLLHPWVGLVFAMAVAWMFVTWRADMRTVDADREWRRAMRHYIRNEDGQVPAAGRFNYGQKTMFWVMVWAALALLISGVVLWWPEAFAAAPLNAVRQAAILVHAVAGARHDRRVHRPSLLGPCRRAGRTQRDPAWRRQRRMGPRASRALGGRAVVACVGRVAWSRTLTTAAPRARRGRFTLPPPRRPPPIS